MTSQKVSASDEGSTVHGSVVIPAVSVPSTDICLRSLAPTGVHTVVVSEDSKAKSFHSKYCDEAVLVPDPTTDLEGYARALLALARRDDVLTIVPVREPDIFVLSKHREAFAEHVATPWPTLETLGRVHDRVLLTEAAAAAGVPAPSTRPLSEVETVTEPSVVKSRYNLLVDEYVDTVPPGHVVQNNTIEHVQPCTVPPAERLQEAFNHDPIFQEFVPIDEEYMIGALYDHGEPLAMVQHKQIRGESYTGGGGVYRESIYDETLENDALALLDELEWHGLACIEYMRHPKTGEFYLTEINPRMWTSLSANVQMGADFPRHYWQLGTDRSADIDAEYDRGVGCHYLKGELMYVLSLLRDDSSLIDRPSLPQTILEIVGSCYRHSNFDVCSRDDPQPFIQDVLVELSGLAPDTATVRKLERYTNRTDPPVHWREATDEIATKERVRH